MYLFFITSVLSLLLGPDVRLLNAEEASIGHTTNHSMVFSRVTEPTPSNILHNTAAEETRNTTPFKDRFSTMEDVSTGVGEVTQTSEEQHQKTTTPKLPATSKVLTTPDPPTTPEPTPLQVDTTETMFDSTLVVTPESTSQPNQPEQEPTTEAPQTPSPSPTIPEATVKVTTAPVFTSFPPLYTTDTSPTTTPTATPTATPTPTTATITTTTNATTLEEMKLKPTEIETTMTPSPEDIVSTTVSSPDTSSSSSNIANGAGSTHDNKKESNWIIIAIIALVAFCILTTICVLVIVMKRRKRSGKQNFGYVNGQRSKKKKAPDNDVWAGPVELGGGDCEGPEEGDAQGEEKKMDGTEVTGLSTFVTLEENGGVGRPGSPEAEKWEEKEPLLFIDEEGKDKAKGAGKSEDADANGGAEKSEDADAKGGAGKTDTKEAELNGGETFCLTTAV